MKYRRADLARAYTLGDQDPDQQYLKRWAAMYNLLRTIPADNRFDMNTWVQQRKTACGTAACAAGHAMLHPWFRRRKIMENCSIGFAFDPEFENLEDAGGHMDFDNYGFFGLGGWGDFQVPFSPDFCAVVLDYWQAPTPIMVSEVVRAWMLNTWSKEQVDKAIEEHAHVVYDIDAVHRYTPWNNVKQA